MQHLGTRRLETKRLILRRIELTDASDMYRNWASDDDVTRYLVWPSHSSEEVSYKYIQSLQKGYESDQYYDWGIELKDKKQLIGTIGVARYEEKVELVHINSPVFRKRVWSECKYLFTNINRYYEENEKYYSEIKTLLNKEEPRLLKDVYEPLYFSYKETKSKISFENLSKVNNCVILSGIAGSTFIFPDNKKCRFVEK